MFRIKIKNKIILILLTIFSFQFTGEFASAQNTVQINQQKFARLLRIIDGYYVDSTNVDDLTEVAIKNMLSELDPHSVYISKEEVAKMNEPLKGNFEGIGISFNIFKDTLMVVTTIPGGPSEKVGLRAGDRIIYVDGENIAGTGIKNTDVFKMLRGKKGTKVNLKVKRNSNKDLLDFTIIRDKIPIFSLDAAYMLDDKTGYIKLNKFAATTVREFQEGLSKLKKEHNLENLILDLRGNGGGYLKSAINLADQFLKEDKLVVYTDSKSNKRTNYKSTSKGDFENGRLIILVNESSASASEIVAGAVQDWDRGIIIGRRSFGKGLVQKPFLLNDKSMVRLTTAHYYTPSGRCIQKPYDEGTKAYRQDYKKRLESGELFSADSINFPDSLKYKTLINKRTVYGGGGIMPDFFIPMDTSSHYRYYNKLRSNNIVYNYVLNYVDQNRSELKSNYSDFSKFFKNFTVDSIMVNTIVENGEKEGIEKNEESLAFAYDKLKTEVKAFIARDLYGTSEFYQVYYKDDETIKKALDVIEDKKNYQNLLLSNE